MDNICYFALIYIVLFFMKQVLENLVNAAPWERRKITFLLSAEKIRKMSDGLKKIIAAVLRALSNGEIDKAKNIVDLMTEETKKKPW